MSNSCKTLFATSSARFSRLSSSRLRSCSGVLALVLVCGVTPLTSDGGDVSKPAPAKVEGAVKEAELATIILTPEAEQRLGIATTAVEERTVQRTRLFGGEVVIPPGQSVTVAAPLTGRLLGSREGSAVPGASVSRGQVVLRLWPVVGAEREALSPSDRIARLRANVDIDAATVEAEGQVAKAQVAADAARLKVERARELRERNAGSDRAYDEARAELESSEATLQAAKRRLAFLAATSVDPQPSAVPELPIDSPIEGVLQDLFVTENQVVTAGTPLFSVADLRTVWIRIPVYVGELSTASGDTAFVAVPGAATGPKQQTARRVAAPRSASAAASTADLFFELATPELSLRPGQRVMVTLPIEETAARLTIPSSALVYDIHGSSWVYENVQPHVFTRRRVELERIEEATAILRRGLRAGAQVVAAGAAELYGTEFGVGK